MDGVRGGLIAGGGQASILLIDDEDYEIQTEVRNVHNHVTGGCRVEFDDPEQLPFHGSIGNIPCEHGYWIQEEGRDIERYSP